MGGPGTTVGLMVVVAVAGMTATDGDAGRLAATANGQVVCRIDERQAIVACDAGRPEAGRDLVGPAGPAAPRFVAVACLPGDVVATVCRAGDDWCLRTYRTEPGRSVDAAAPLQELAIGRASGPATSVDLAVSHARGWLVVTGLPPPLPPVVRAAVGGVRVGPLSDRSCPRPAAGWRPVAAAVSPLDELVLLLRPPGAAAGKGPPDDELAYYDTTGRQLLRLPAGIRGTAGLDFNRGDGTLWAAATNAQGRSGLWRLDAAYAAGRQVIRPVLVAAFSRPRDLVCPTSRRIVLTFGEPLEPVAVIDPSAPSPGVEP